MLSRSWAMMLAAAALLWGSVGAADPARAGKLQVNPVRLEIAADRRTASVTIRNEEDVPVTIRAYPMAWMQVNGEDRYEESREVIVSPPIFTIPGGGTQIVRVGLREDAGSRAYRLMIEEVPGASPGGGVQVALRLNLPLFADMAQGRPADLLWRILPRAEGGGTVEAVNQGSAYVRIEPAEAEAATGLEAAEASLFGVVLPNSSRRWVLPRFQIVDRDRFDALSQAAGGGGAQSQTRRD